MKVYIVVPSELKEYYQSVVEKNNHQHKGDNGIDIPFTENVVFIEGQTTKVNLGIKVHPQDTDKGLDLRPRSSIGNVPLILTNSVGLIDNNYRGPVTAKLHFPIQSDKLDELKMVYPVITVLLIVNWLFYVIGWNTIGFLINLFVLISNFNKTKPKQIKYFKKGESLLQLVAPDTEPIELVIVDELNETTRGEGKFGSTTANNKTETE